MQVRQYFTVIFMLYPEERNDVQNPAGEDKKYYTWSRDMLQ